MGLWVMTGEQDHADDRQNSADSEATKCERREVIGFTEHGNGDRDRDERVDDREPGDYEIGRADGICRLHEIATQQRGDDQSDDAQDHEFVDLVGLPAIDENLRDGDHEAIEGARGDDVEHCPKSFPEDEECDTGRDDDGREQPHDEEQLCIGECAFEGVDGRERNEDSDSQDGKCDTPSNARIRGNPVDTRVDDVRENHRDHTKWLHDDEGREPERNQLDDDGERQQECSDHPGGATQQKHHLPPREAGFRAITV